MSSWSHATTVGYVAAVLVELAARSAGAQCMPAVSCTCDSVRDRVLLRATVVEVRERALTLRIHDVLSRPDRGNLAEGDFVSGDSAFGPPCGSPEARELIAGDEVFAAAGRDLAQPPGSCGDAGVCSANLWVIPWQDTLHLGGTDTIPATQASELGEQASCLARFPAPQTPCNDLRTIGGCAFALPSPGRTSQFGALALLGVAACQRRRRSW